MRGSAGVSSISNALSSPLKESCLKRQFSETQAPFHPGLESTSKFGKQEWAAEATT